MIATTSRILSNRQVPTQGSHRTELLAIAMADPTLYLPPELSEVSIRDLLRSLNLPEPATIGLHISDHRRVSYSLRYYISFTICNGAEACAAN